MTPPNDEHRTFERLREALAAVEQIEGAYLFGSAARGTAAPRSDVDVAVLVGRPSAGERTLELIAALQPAVSPRRLDLVVLDDAPTTLSSRCGAPCGKAWRAGSTRDSMVDPDVVSLRLAELDRRIGLLRSLRSDSDLDAYLLGAPLPLTAFRRAVAVAAR